MIKFIKMLLASYKEGQRRRAAFEMAQHLVRNNKDFERIGLSDLYTRILDEENKTFLDGTPVEKS